ncbi:MAG: protoporphyrinogen oxidase [Gemmataceae bacterium]
MPSVVIVGAGVSGLSLAYRLGQIAPVLDITLLESDSRAGGKVWTLREQGFTVEMGPNGFLDSKPTTLQLTRDLGLDSHLVPASDAAARKRFLFLNGRLSALPSGLWSFLSSPLLSWRGKLSLFLERFRRKPIPDDESIADFAARRTSREIADTFADALVTGIYAGDTTRLSLPACFPRLAALERQYGSVLKGLGAEARKRRQAARAEGKAPARPGKLWSLRQGLGALIEGLLAQVRRPPLLGVGVRRIAREGSRWLVEGEGRERWDADVVVLACPAFQQAAILSDVDPALAEEIGAIPYNRIAVVALGYREADAPGLDGFGYIAPQRTGRDILGVQWCSSTYPGRAPAGTVLLRAMAGGWRRPEVAAWNDERLVASIRAELRVAQGIEAAPVFQRIVRWDRAIPQYHVGHLARVARIERLAARHPGLFLGGNAYHGVALNDCTEQALLVAERIRDVLKS